MSIPEFNEIEQNDQKQVLRWQWEAVLRQVGIEPNDQTMARFDNALELRKLVGNIYPNKFVRTNVCGKEDTITNLKAYEPVMKIVAEMETWKKDHEGERPLPEFKDARNARLKEFGSLRISGRMTTPPRGNFVHLTDGINKLQVYCNKKGPLALVLNDGNDTLDDANGWAAFTLLDHGDFIGVEGYLFITNTGELSVHVEKLQFLAKAMLPMPDKMHGIADAEIKQRQRYVDLIGSSLRVESQESGVESELTTREVFERRAKIISSMRRFLEDHDYIEVETPMLTPKATGAAAKPFKTHHNALDIDLYARIAPELYLKRLVVGGFEKVYELNRNFRNEGISYKHNPEFTMLEFYCAYMDVEGMMNFCEELMRQSVQKAVGSLKINYEGESIDFDEVNPKTGKEEFRRRTMRQAITEYWPESLSILGNDILDLTWLDDLSTLFRLRALLLLTGEEFNKFINQKGNELEPHDFKNEKEFWSEYNRRREQIRFEKKDICWEKSKMFLAGIPSESLAKQCEIGQNTLHMFQQSVHSGLPNEIRVERMVLDLFEGIAEGKLIQPTFIIDFPKSISPLSKASPENPNIAERFELFINGMEVANGFSELNDPKEQYERFVDQMSERERGDEEAMILDEDYIRALSYGMPPAAGIGIGIDRLVMLLTNKHSIRDVILFPHMRPVEVRVSDSAEGVDSQSLEGFVIVSDKSKAVDTPSHEVFTTEDTTGAEKE